MAGRTIDGCTVVAGDASDGWLGISFMADRKYGCTHVFVTSW